ncbi:MAG: NrfD/PsrC family molybdoenzyme membrane anchor subunit [Anaerolineae bacterium]
MEGFVYPNDIEVRWSLMIVLYPYITGLVAGAFIISSLYHVFGVTKLRPVARLSLVSALAFLLVAPLPLVLHLGRPERAFEMFVAPNLRSAMSGFGYIWLFYLILLLLEVWLVFRKDIVELAKSSTGFKRPIYAALALGVYDISEASLSVDQKLISILAAIGIPGACLLHGYVGFIFGAIKANPWWSTPLMPIIFLLSAIVSGIALLIVVYIGATLLTRRSLDHDCVSALADWLLGFLVVDVTLEVLEVVMRMYESEESWELIRVLITQKLNLTYFGLQLGLGALVPLILLGTIGVLGFRPQIRTAVRFMASVLVLIGVFAMRWNVVIGGQLFSKSLRGFTHYTPELMGHEGILAAAGLMALPFFILALEAYLVPIWYGEPAQRKVPVAMSDDLPWSR